MSVGRNANKKDLNYEKCFYSAKRSSNNFILFVWAGYGTA